MGMISDYVRSGADNIAGAYKEGGVGKAFGTALRTMAGAVPAASAAYDEAKTSAVGAAQPIIAAAADPVFKFAEGLTGTSAGGLAPSPAPAPAPAPAGGPAPGGGLPGAGIISGSSTAGPVGASPAGPQTNLAPRNVPLITAAQAADVERRAYAPTVYAGAQPQAAPDPNAAIIASLNDGTWSGMINARTMAKRTDADRAAAVAATGAQSGVLNAASGRISALANAANAQTNAMKEQAQAGLIGEQVKSSQAEQSRRADADKLAKEMADPKTTPERRKEIERILVAVHGRNPTQPQVHASPVFDAMGQKVGENMYERQPDGSWKNVTPKPSINEDPRAQAIKAEFASGRIKDSEARQRLQAIGYQ
jgi:hypothetical protein